MEELKFQIIEHPDKKDWKTLLKRPEPNSENLEQKVLEVLKEVKTNGDEALRLFTRKFDNIELQAFDVKEDELKAAGEKVPDPLKEAINIAKNNIEKFHASQQEEVKKIEINKGVTCWRRSVPIQKVGLYVPGGTAPLFSTVLMLGIPAKIAGCKEIIICTPPDKEGAVHPAILYTAQLLGINKIYKIGGAQAIAAMAYGTASIPQVYKIFGPGNQYVTAAKQLVSKEGTAIDVPAGPSEVAIIAGHTCNIAFVAAEILSQAEHGENSQAILVTNKKALIEKVQHELANQLEHLPRKEFALKGLENSKFFLVKDMDEAIDIVNEYAPEHLVLQVDNYEQIATKIENAGSVFLGNYTPVAAGDYGSGTNHTLPTNGHAKAYSGVSVDSFVKKITFQHISEEGIKNIGPVIEIMAEAEGLQAHRNSIRIRNATT